MRESELHSGLILLHPSRCSHGVLLDFVHSQWAANQTRAVRGPVDVSSPIAELGDGAPQNQVIVTKLSHKSGIFSQI